MNLEEITKKLNEAFSPVSIVLYGSRARTDFLLHSDYEIGLFYAKDKPVEWSDIKEVVNEQGVNIYPFDYEDFLKGTFDTPFQKTIYKRELIVAGKTLSGKNIQVFELPPIQVIDLLEDIRFYSGRALDAVLSLRQGDEITASSTFSKSCLFATRDLIMLELNAFPYTYDKIYSASQELKLENFMDLVIKAYYTRKNKDIPQPVEVIKNVTYINTIVEPLIKKAFKENPQRIIVP